MVWVGEGFWKCVKIDNYVLSWDGILVRVGFDLGERKGQKRVKLKDVRLVLRV